MNDETKIEDLPLSVRVFNSLMEAKIFTVSQMQNASYIFRSKAMQKEIDPILKQYRREKYARSATTDRTD